ncbi:MAG: metallophosphoesterase [Clostridiales bacterium]|nr:metallophosphoesterase [Clostridiales bacterium]
MTKIIILSDIHFNAVNLKKIDKIILESDYCFFLGDGGNAMANYQDRLGGRLITLRGNCDFWARAETKDEALLDIDGFKILATHGHKYGVKLSLDNLVNRAKQLKADIALFGHTHIAYLGYIGNILLVNPGSLGSPRIGAPSYAYMLLSLAQKPLVKIVEVK